MKRALKLLCGVILPWCGLAGLLAYEGHKLWAEHRLRERVIAKAHLEAAPDHLRAVKRLGRWGAFDVIAYDYMGSEGIGVRAYDQTTFLLSREDYHREMKNLHCSVYLQDGYPFLDCGSDSGEFPGFLVLQPRAGPDAGRSLTDRDLDGQFEEKGDRAGPFWGIPFSIFEAE